MNRHTCVIVYFSYSGNTRNLAHYIQKRLRCDLLSIVTKESYASEYEYLIDPRVQDVHIEEFPALKKWSMDLDGYDTVILCTPIWWFSLAPAVKSFLRNHDLKQKTIVPFITHGGYGLGHSIEDLRKLSPDARILKVNEIPFTIRKMMISFEELNLMIKMIRDMEG